MNVVRLLRRIVAIAGCLSLFMMSSAARADDVYHLEPGDVVEVSFGSAPDSRQRVQVQMDGTVSLPAIGTVAIAGLTPKEMRVRIEAAAVERSISSIRDEGRSGSSLIQPGDVTATVVEYRPVYVKGDVRSPGQYPYRPFLTVRQVVAISGGYGSAPLDGSSSSDIRRDLYTLWIEYLRVQARSSRLAAEASDLDSFDPNQWSDTPLPKATTSEVIKAELHALKLRVTDYIQERAFLQRAVEQADAHIVVLTEQQHQEELGLQADTQELEKIKKLFEIGNVPSPRLTETRRALLLSSTRKLQTAVELMQVKRQRDEYLRQLERGQNKRKADLLLEQSESAAKQADLRSKITTLEDKLRLTGSMMSLQKVAAAPEAVILRKSQREWTRIQADEDMPLMPGDVVEITLQMDSIDRSASKQ